MTSTFRNTSPTFLPWNATLQKALDRLSLRVQTTHDAAGAEWPYHADPATGKWELTHDGDWCGGHWVECLRIAAELSGREDLQREALVRTDRLRPYLERDDQFRGHRFYYSAARQYDLTGDHRLRTLALAAAYAMRSMAMSSNGAMPIGTQVQVKSTTLASRSIVAVDNVHPNLCLDWWAFRQTGDEAFHSGARAHLETTYRDFVRPDGSTVEFIEYDPASGLPQREFTLLGAHDQSCWSRGQAWAIAGYLRAWEELRDERYLTVARQLLGYWQRHCADDLIPPWDFMDPALQTNPGAVPVDTSAAAIVVEQLARIAVHDELRAQAPDLMPVLTAMMNGLIGHIAAFEVGLPEGRLLDGCFNQPRKFANHDELLWGSAYLLFALFYLKKRAAPL